VTKEGVTYGTDCPPFDELSSSVKTGELTMADILLGYAVAIAIVFFASRPFSINRPRTGRME
jgi:hypothetical protein